MIFDWQDFKRVNVEVQWGNGPRKSLDYIVIWWYSLDAKVADPSDFKKVNEKVTSQCGY